MGEVIFASVTEFLLLAQSADIFIPYMHLWCGIALVAYLIGAAIEGISTISQLSQLVPELVEGADQQPLESADPPKKGFQVFAVITAVSVCGAIFWPCRLLHRSLKNQQNRSAD